MIKALVVNSKLADSAGPGTKKKEIWRRDDKGASSEAPAIRFYDVRTYLGDVGKRYEYLVPVGCPRHKLGAARQACMYHRVM